MPLTQELIGDALGLSVLHVNRTLRQLREDGLITIDSEILFIEDIEDLAALADFDIADLSRLCIGELLGN
jgi:DNA-binding transcriptional regulator LsrR (DeoR family)